MKQTLYYYHKIKDLASYEVHIALGEWRVLSVIPSRRRVLETHRFSAVLQVA
jgi:hypothetical protein